jgi:predicted nicotinamide N-methyase
MYDEQIVSVNIGETKIDLIQVNNIDQIFDRLIKMQKDDQQILDDLIPYWMELWPSAIGLSQFIEENPLIFRDKSLIELGAGLGLPSLIASNYSKHILTTDLLPDAIAFAQRNAFLNEINHIRYELLDWRKINQDYAKYDVILASDIAYEKRFFEYLPSSIKKLMHNDSVAIISEPGRHFAKQFLADLEYHFDVKIFNKIVDHRGVTVKVGLYVLRGK